MGYVEDKFSGDDINYSGPIREMIFNLRKSIRNHDKPFEAYDALKDFKTLTEFTLNSIKEWNYSLICSSLSIPFYQSKRKIFKEISKKWEKNKEAFDYEKNLIGLENIYACSVLELDEEDFLFVDKIMLRFQAIYLSYSLENFVKVRTEGERQRFGHDLRKRLQDNYQFKSCKSEVIFFANELMNRPPVGPIDMYMIGY